MSRNGIPATAVLAGGISRHGSVCNCRYCAPRTADQRQAISVVRCSCHQVHGGFDSWCAVHGHNGTMRHAVADAGVIQPPVKLADVATGPAAPRTFDEMFAAARETISKLEQERDARTEPMTTIDWSPAQACRRAA